MDENIAKIIADLRDKQRELKEKVEKIESAILSLQELFGENVVSLDAGSTEYAHLPAKGIYTGLTIGQAAIKYLQSVGKPIKTRPIAVALEQGGGKSSDMYRAVYNALDLNEDVEMVEGKRWALKAWRASDNG